MNGVEYTVSCVADGCNHERSSGIISVGIRIYVWKDFLLSAQRKSDFENQSNSSEVAEFPTMISLVLLCALRYSLNQLFSLAITGKK